jgi:hypothetical protein
LQHGKPNVYGPFTNDAKLTLCETLAGSSWPNPNAGAHDLVAAIRRQRGDEVALLATELLAQRRAERISSVGA